MAPPARAALRGTYATGPPRGRTRGFPGYAPRGSAASEHGISRSYGERAAAHYHKHGRPPCDRQKTAWNPGRTPLAACPGRTWCTASSRHHLLPNHAVVLVWCGRGVQPERTADVARGAVAAQGGHGLVSLALRPRHRHGHHPRPHVLIGRVRVFLLVAPGHRLSPGSTAAGCRRAAGRGRGPAPRPPPRRSP